MGRITPSFAVTRVELHDAAPDAAGTSRARVVTDTRADLVTGEEPLEIRMGGQVLTTTMRTPGADLDLVHGLLYSEGVIASADEVAEARYCAGATGADGRNTYNVLEFDLTRPEPLAPEFIRGLPTSSACGVCGSTSIAQVLGKPRPPITPLKLDPELVVQLPDRLRAEQKAFRKTGGIHAAGAFTAAGEPVVTREDIGRHNAADKVIGALLRQGQLPADNMILVMSSRASFELVQKAVTAGFSALVAVSAASSLAVELAREAGLALTGFTRGNRFNLYSGALKQG
ncbi:formate dehydrogenase [Corynebacterium atypicum]|uniref:Sulfur carrier protein FdhD n=1 Tax=Corynebacterium atypicum TaxID=191610 RepID=A0ABM5QLH7_9CORY|nr:formate dehydrogenase accessory sulfurtransferase FdhD [Corynebacterium atypicum]AIG63672.1 formate dehydrogenase [Corynebacterium atypicum]